MRKPTLMSAQARYKKKRKQVSFLMPEAKNRLIPKEYSYREIFLEGCQALKKRKSKSKAIKTTPFTRALRKKLEELRKLLINHKTEKAFSFNKGQYERILKKFHEVKDTIAYIELEMREKFHSIYSEI